MKLLGLLRVWSHGIADAFHVSPATVCVEYHVHAQDEYVLRHLRKASCILPWQSFFAQQTRCVIGFSRSSRASKSPFRLLSVLIAILFGTGALTGLLYKYCRVIWHFHRRKEVYHRFMNLSRRPHNISVLLGEEEKFPFMALICTPLIMSLDIPYLINPLFIMAGKSSLSYAH